MNFKSWLVGLCATLCFGVSNATTFSIVHGKNLDLYYDATAFGSDVTATGDSFYFKNSAANSLFVDGYATVVAHAGVSLYGSWSATYTGNYQVWLAQKVIQLEEYGDGWYYDTKGRLITQHFMPTTLMRTVGEGPGVLRQGTVFGGSGDRSEIEDPIFGRINFHVYMQTVVDDPDYPLFPKYVKVDGYTINFATVSAVPEPETYAMLLAGLALIGAGARRRKR